MTEAAAEYWSKIFVQHKFQAVLSARGNTWQGALKQVTFVANGRSVWMPTRFHTTPLAALYDV